MRNAIIQICIPDENYNIISQKSAETIREYCQKVDCEYIQINNDTFFPGMAPVWQRFVVFESFHDKYDKIAYIDADIIVNDHAENLFQFDGFAAIPARPQRPDPAAFDRANIGNYFPEHYKDKYFNAGLFMIDQPTRALFKPYYKALFNKVIRLDQGVLNSLVLTHMGGNYTQLDKSWNCFAAYATQKELEESYFLHLSGASSASRMQYYKTINLI